MKLFRLSRAGEPAIYTVLMTKLGVRAETVKVRFDVPRKKAKNTPQPRVPEPACLISFAICVRLFQADAMTQPLALVLYEKLLPGSQLVNRLQDLNYRVQTIADAASAAVLETKRDSPPVDRFAGAIYCPPARFSQDAALPRNERRVY